MKNLFLTKPNLSFKASYLEMLKEWEQTKENMVPWVLKLDYSDFNKMVNYLLGISNGVDLKDGQVKCSTFWLMRSDGKMLGVSNLRHELDERLYNYGGHIGYGIRPGERLKGYATEILKLSLDEAKSLGIDKVRITCDRGNIGSEKVILKNGGIFDSEMIEDKKVIKRFWISLSNK